MTRVVLAALGLAWAAAVVWHNVQLWRTRNVRRDIELIRILGSSS